MTFHRNKLISLVMSLLLLTSAVGCSYTVLGCAAVNCTSCGEKIKEEVAETVKEEIKDNVPQLGTLFTTPVPTETPEDHTEGTPAANEAFLAMDRQIFTWYVTSDVVTMDQYCHNPADYGIDEKSVPVTLGDFSEEAQDVWVSECKSWLERLKKLDCDNLSSQNRFAYDNYVRYFENEVAYDGLFYYYEPLDEIVGLQVNLPLTFGLYEFYDVTDVENYLVLLADVPRYFEQVLAFEQKRAELGIFMTEEMLDMVLLDFDNVVNSRETNYLYATFREALDEVDWLTDEQRSSYYEQNDALVKGAFTDAYAALREGMEQLRPYCRTMTGAKNVDEKALRYFELALRTQSANDMTVEDALAFLERVSMDLYYALLAAYRNASNREIDYTTGSIEGDERYLKTLITDIVPKMPDVNVVYKEIPPELQDGFSPAAYLIPAVDHYMDNTILINPKSKSDLLTLAHEGYPGHMYQYTYQFNLGTIPLFQMAIEPIGYAEAWSTNAEYSVAKRADMFGAADCTMEVLNDNLTSAIVMAATIMVNGQGASKAQMREFLGQWGFDDAETVDLIYERAVNLPIYYFKYSMGFCQQFDLTETCREIYDFNDKDFYEEYLSWGPSYFDLLEPKMIEWAKRMAAKSA